MGLLSPRPLFKVPTIQPEQASFKGYTWSRRSLPWNLSMVSRPSRTNSQTSPLPVSPASPSSTPPSMPSFQPHQFPLVLHKLHTVLSQSLCWECLFRTMPLPSLANSSHLSKKFQAPPPLRRLPVLPSNPNSFLLIPFHPTQAVSCPRSKSWVYWFHHQQVAPLPRKVAIMTFISGPQHGA